MTNNTIIFNEVASVFTPEEIHALVTSAFTPEYIKKASETMSIEADGMDPVAALEAFLAAGLFHTFQYWKACGYSVKKGEHAAITCYLWKYTEKAAKAEIEAKALPEECEDPEHNPRFYKVKAHLFHLGQVKKGGNSGKKEYAEMLLTQRTA